MFMSLSADMLRKSVGPLLELHLLHDSACYCSHLLPGSREDSADMLRSLYSLVARNGMLGKSAEFLNMGLKERSCLQYDIQKGISTSINPLLQASQFRKCQQCQCVNPKTWLQFFHTFLPNSGYSMIFIYIHEIVWLNLWFVLMLFMCFCRYFFSKKSTSVMAGESAPPSCAACGTAEQVKPLTWRGRDKRRKEPFVAINPYKSMRVYLIKP